MKRPPLPLRARPLSRALAAVKPGAPLVGHSSEMTVVTAEWCRVLQREGDLLDARLRAAQAESTAEQGRAWRVLGVAAALLALQNLADEVRRRGRPQKCKGQDELRAHAVAALGALDVTDLTLDGVRFHVVPGRTAVVNTADGEVVAVATAESYVRVSLERRPPPAPAQLVLPLAKVVSLDAHRLGRALARGK